MKPKNRAGKPTAPKAPKPKAPRVKMKKEAVIDCRHTFTDAEKIDLGIRLTGTMTTRENVLEQKKTMAKEFDSKVKIFDGEIGSLHSKIHDGYEFRPTKCVIHFNKATVGGKAVKRLGTKRIVRADNGAHVRDEPMSPGDLQDELFEVQRQTHSEADKPDPGYSAAAKGTNADGTTKSDDQLRKEGHINSPEVPEKAGETKSTAATA